MNDHQVSSIRQAADTARRHGRDPDDATVTAARCTGVDEWTIQKARQVARVQHISIAAALASMPTRRRGGSRAGGVW